MLVPRVLIIHPDQWPRALLRAQLRERGYDAIGAPLLRDALIYPPAEPGRGPVRLLIVAQAAVDEEADTDAFERLWSRHRRPPLLLVARSRRELPPARWATILHPPTSIPDIVATVQRLIPLAPPAPSSTGKV